VTISATDSTAEDENWIGFLVLTIAPHSHRSLLVAGTQQAETVVLRDPVLADMARVTAGTEVDSLATDIDELAVAVRWQLLSWVLSARSIAAPRFTFGLLVLHTDPVEADRLTQQLAATNVLSELPIVFQVGAVQPRPGTDVAGSPPTAEQTNGVAGLVLDAVDATARQIELAAAFSIDASTLRGLATARPHTPESTPIDSGTDRSDEQPIDVVAGAPAADAGAEGTSAAPADPSSAETHPGQPVGQPEPASRLRLLVGSLQARFARRPVPATTIEVINHISEQVQHVRILYIVSAAEPVPPSRWIRERRREIALGIARAVLSPLDSGLAEPWFVRAFAASQSLHPAMPLAEPDHLRGKDFPECWGDYFDLYECVGDIINALERDTASFARRGQTEEPTAVVIVLAGEPPSGDAETERRFHQLLSAATVLWVIVGSAPTATPDQFADTRYRLLAEHEDVVDEMITLLKGLARPQAESDHVAEPSGRRTAG
jgi:hypothetical protein